MTAAKPRVWAEASLDEQVQPLVRAFHAELCRRYERPHVRSRENRVDPMCVRAYKVVVQYGIDLHNSEATR